MTNDIRKALPSRFYSGNATALWNALKEAPIEEKFVVQSFGNLIKNLNWGDISKTKNLSRDSSLAATASKRLSTLNFSKQAKNIAAAVVSEINQALAEGLNPDQAVAKGYTVLINQIKQIKISDSFENVVKGMHKEVDRVMAEKLNNSPMDQHQTINEFGKACKDNIVSSLLLRTLNPELVNAFLPETINKT